MTKSEMLANWKKTSAIKQEFSKKLGERFPHLCYTDVKLLEKINATLQSLTTALSNVKDGEPEVKAKAKKEEAKPEAGTKIAEHEVKADAKANAKAANNTPTKA